jgi:hypothetical protein
MTRFVVDTMLGTLAKWLRAAGYDARYEPHRLDVEMLEISRAESRVVLTRDAELARRGGGMAMLVPRGDLDAQIKAVAGTYPERDSPPLSRCLECNERLVRIGFEEAQGLLPDGVATRQVEFRRCPACRKVFWPGSHYDAMSRRIQALLPEPSALR